MYFHHPAVLGTFFSLVVASPKYEGPDYNSLPLDTLFPGPWESNIKAPVNKTYITPVRIFNFEGATVGAESVLQGADANANGGLTWGISPGGLITFEFAENIGGKVCFEVEDTKNSPFLVLSYSESPFFAGRECDSTGDQQERDLPLRYAITHKGMNCVGGGYNRGAFKYLTVFMPEYDMPTEGGLWHDGHVAPKRVLAEPSWYHRLGQKLLGHTPPVRYHKSKVPSVSISAVWVNCTAFPSNSNGRAYTGYFDSSSSVLNRVWYAGAWTLQLSTIDPKEGGSIIQFNRLFDGNTAPVGAWYSNYTVAKGTAVTTDGAKRDRMVWPGDMTIAVPGIAVSTYDMLAIRNALDVIYDHQYSDGSMPYAGPPMGAFGEFSDTYHLHTLIGTYFYVLYSGDIDWLEKNWKAYRSALEVSIRKVDDTGLLHVSSDKDWNRLGMTGHNIEASSLLYEVLGNSQKLTTWLHKKNKKDIAHWIDTRERLSKGINRILYCPRDGMFADNLGRRGCEGVEKCLPQDGNSWALISGVVSSDAVAYNVSENLRRRWTKYGAPAVEFPNVISPYASSFELIGHSAVGNIDAAVELTELMWGYMMDGPGMTNSTLLESYRIDGYIQYPLYWAAARNSHAHGWSVGPTTVLMQSVLGIKLTSPLGKKWKIEPVLSKWLSYARGGFATKLGKFEVDVTLMRSLSTGRRIESLKFSVPKESTGTLKWGAKEMVYTKDMGNSFSYYRYVDEMAMVDQEWQVWTADAMIDYIVDDTFVKPVPEEWPEGVVDWVELERNYALAGQRFKVQQHDRTVETEGMGMLPQEKKTNAVVLKEQEKLQQEDKNNFAETMERYKDFLSNLEAENKEGLARAGENQDRRYYEAHDEAHDETQDL